MAMRTGDLDDEIAAIEKRIASRRDALAALSTDARRHVSGKTIMPMAIAAALGIGFAASRFLRKARPAPLISRRLPPASRALRIAGALASLLLPRLMGPLSVVAAQWIRQRMRRGY